jgi:hypothetical protein
MTDGEIVSFRIDRWTPDSIPMARLGEYMQLVAELYGEAASVHFKRLRKGSAVLDSVVQIEAFPKVYARLEAVKTSAASEDLRKSYEKIDSMLRADNAVATISRAKGGKIIEFPGRKLAKPEPITITQPTVVDGVVVRIGGVDETIPLVLQDAEGVQYRCTIRGRVRAREMAKYLYGDPIRVSGNGKWIRDSDGNWRLENMTVIEHEELEPGSLADAIADLQKAAAGGGWTAESLERWKRDRES